MRAAAVLIALPGTKGETLVVADSRSYSLHTATDRGAGRSFKDGGAKIAR
jgi:hypothetical protein